jgi:Abnormal spindle-like microcephaly-assoc'd, ASPM-SPD-2-Hydin
MSITTTTAAAAAGSGRSAGSLRRGRAAARVAALGLGLALPLGGGVAAFASTAPAGVPAVSPAVSAATSTPSHRLAVSTHTLAFGSVDTGASKNLTVTVSNTGTKTLTPVPVLSGSAEFTLGAGTCTSLAARQTCAYTLSFAPTAAGPVTANLAVLSTQGTPAQNVALSGTGVQQVMESYFYLYTYANPPAINGIAAPQSFTGTGYAPAATYTPGQIIPVFDPTGLHQIGSYRIGTVDNTLALDPAKVGHVAVSAYDWGTHHYIPGTGLISYDGTTGLGSEHGAIAGAGIEGTSATFNDLNPAIVAHHF